MSNVHTTETLIDFLSNDKTAYQAWLALGQKIAQHFFTPVGTGSLPDIKFYWHINSLSYSYEQSVSCRLSYLVRTHLSRIINENDDIDDMHLSYDVINDVASQWGDMLYSEIKCGALQPEKATMDIITVLYGEAGGNIAKTCRITGQSRHFVNKAKDTVSLEAYVRMTRVKTGTPYHIVMGDCAPYCHAFPAFTPVQSIEDENDVKRLIQAGDLVAEWGSSSWHVVSELTSYGNIIFAEEAMIHAPCRRLPKAFAASAARFCSKINNQPASLYVPQDDVAA